MGAVFISYRRADSEGQARALSLELVKLLGRESLFMDVDSIALGRDFRQILQERLQGCDVMLVLIGPRWLDATDTNGNRLLENPRDFVRQEIAAALKRNILVIPVLLQGTPIPAPERLPDDIKDLSYRNGFELEHSTWESDVKEMVKRLGLDQKTTTPEASSPEAEAPPRLPRPPAAMKRGAVVAAAAAPVVAGLLFYYLNSKAGPPQQPQASVTDAVTTQTLPGTTTPLGRGGSVTNTQLTPSPTAGGIAVSGLEFNWPGNDCWDIFRGAELVTSQCGANQQALQAGTYVIKGKYAPVFTPFDVVIKAGSPTRIAMGGVLDFRWPGNDCWDIFRGEEYVIHQCGAQKQALIAGSYTVKGKYAPVFLPFRIDIKNGSSTRVDAGGVFTFNWPGTDCWDIFRGAELVIGQCGTNQQALQAGTYTIKGKYAPVFEPFTIKVTDGAQVKAP
jgi:TIR domain-containing protein